MKIRLFLNNYIKKTNKKKIFKNQKESKYLITNGHSIDFYRRIISPLLFQKFIHRFHLRPKMFKFYWPKDSTFIVCIRSKSQIVSFLFSNQKYMWSQRYFFVEWNKWLMFRCNFNSRTRQLENAFVDGALNHRQIYTRIVFYFIFLEFVNI